MSRPIKFRVWDSFNRKWLEDHEFCVWQGNVCRIETGATSINSFGSSYNPLELEVSKFGCPYIDNNLTIHQYTGLNDKNGKEIYEGDIVKTPFAYMFRSNIHVVQYIQNRFVPDDIYDDDKVTIIGNICENADLIDFI